MGRFLSVDPVVLEGSGVAEGDPQSLSPYSYARNTPTSLVDRDGRFANVAIGALAGAVIGTGVYLAKAAINDEKVTARGLLGSAAGGAVSGAIAGGTMGASLAVAGVGGSIGGSVAGGVIERAISTGSLAATVDPSAMAFDATVGAVAPGAAKLVGAGLSATVKHAAPVVRKVVDTARKLVPLRNGSGATRGRIGETGKVGENALKKLGGESQVPFRTSAGTRVVDQLAGNVAHESKVGYTSLSKTVSRQIAKDSELKATGQVKDVVWHFYQSPVTGEIGPSRPLESALRAAGIRFEVHR